MDDGRWHSPNGERTVLDAQYPEGEVSIDEDLVRALLKRQHPDLAELDVSLVDVGWDNVTHRLGDSLAVRTPRRLAAVQLLVNEQRWLPLLSARLGLPVPSVVRTGRPSVAYPWPWSIVRWLRGTTADARPLHTDQAGRIGAALRALHRAAPPEAPRNPFRGVPLDARADLFERGIRSLGFLDAEQVGALRGAWRAAVGAPPAHRGVWLHGDLHPKNVLVLDGRVSGILDWGDLTGGDPATDLSCAWSLFRAAEARGTLLEAYGADSDLVVRARGWAVLFAVGIVASGEPRHVAMGRAMIEGVLDGIGLDGGRGS